MALTKQSRQLQLLLTQYKMLLIATDNFIQIKFELEKNSALYLTPLGFLQLGGCYQISK